jgi:hypothetical protein
MLLNGIRIHMGTLPLLLAAVAIGIGIWKKNAEVLLIFGAAAGTLGMIANLWGDVVGFITPVCVQLWPLAALGLQQLASRLSTNPSALVVAGAIAMIAPITNVISNRPKIELLRVPGEGPGVRALYAQLPMRSALVAENYWLARLVNYMHFSNEITPDPNPRVLDADASEVRAAVTDGLEVYAFEGATHWLKAQGLYFEPTDIARQPFETWLATQPKGTLIVAAVAGRALPFEWLPSASRARGNRPSNFGAIAWTIGDAEAGVEQSDAAATIGRVVGSEGRMLTVASNDDGPAIVWGDDVLVAIDRGLAAAAFNPAGQLIGQWAFSLDERPGVQLPPSPYVLRGERPCEVLRPGQRTEVTRILGDGGWWATAEGTGKAAIKIETSEAPATWRHYLSHGRGEGSVDATGSRLLLDPTRGTRPIFRFLLAPTVSPTFATLEPSDITAVRVCEAERPAMPATGTLRAEDDSWFGAGWHLGERGGTQRFRWSERTSTLTWKMEKAAPVRMLLHLRPAHRDGATIQATINGTPLASCAVPAGAWTDCRFEIPEAAARTGINQLILRGDTVSPPAERPGDPRELAFVMQASRVRIGQ